MPFFNTSLRDTVIQSVKREAFLSDVERRELASEAIDTYRGFGRQYLLKHIDNVTHKKHVSLTLKKIAVQYQFLTNFINQLSQLYSEQPDRLFLLNGEKIENERILRVIDSFYSDENKLKIREAERLTNLLSTTVWKVNNLGGELRLEFVPNNLVQVIPATQDNTLATGIRFLSMTEYTGYNDILARHESWSQESVTIEKSDNDKIVEENEAAIKYTSATRKSFLGPAFPPFAVLRSSVSTEDFWNVSNNDSLSLVKEINLSITELRYLMRYASFGLKYLVNLEAPKDGVIDPTGIWQLSQPSGMPGDEKNFEVGELRNSSDIKAVMDAITSMIAMLYNLFGLDSNSVIASRDAETAESKALDTKRLKEIIDASKPIWSMNENVIFKTFISVWNRDNPGDEIPYDIELKVDFVEMVKSLDEQMREAELWMVRIQNDIATASDWIRAENPDFDSADAIEEFKNNKKENRDNLDISNQDEFVTES